MCINKRYITNFYGRELLVPCGHCPACEQQKAIKRANRIKSNVSQDTVMLFCTWTYKNDFVPYFDLDELLTGRVFHNNEVLDRYGSHIDESFVFQHPNKFDKETTFFKEINIYRDKSVRWVRRTHDYHMTRKISDDRQVLSSVSVPYPLCQTDSFKFLRNKQTYIGQAPHVGVVYYKDMQDYIKRLRSYLHYKKYEKPFSYYVCSEYGPTTGRPHFHGLFTIPREDVFFWKLALSKNWPFDDGRQCFRNIQVSRNAAGYVSSYVNCASSVPQTFKYTSPLRPCHHYSQGFGMALKSFSLPSLLKAFERRDLHYDYAHLKKGTLVVDHLLYPEYVLRRFFPKIKGYSRLNADALRFISERPSRLSVFARELDYNSDDLHRNVTMLSNKLKLFLNCGYSVGDYSRVYSEIWQIRASNLLGDLYNSIVQPSLNFYAYDNIADYFVTGLGSESFDSLNFDKPYGGFILDPNDFPENLSKHYSLVQSYDSYSKDRKIRNLVYSDIFNV